MTTTHSAGPGLVVLYRWRLNPGTEDTFIAAWSRVTELLREQRGSLGSRLHRGSDNIWYSYAQWPDDATRDRAFVQAAVDPAATDSMKAYIQESYPEIRLDITADFLILPSAEG
ncbi:MAG: antibiotic biosynthesis monooxygenase family protein [Gammaproteobacteria bacterium]